MTTATKVNLTLANPSTKDKSSPIGAAHVMTDVTGPELDTSPGPTLSRPSRPNKPIHVKTSIMDAMLCSRSAVTCQDDREHRGFEFPEPLKLVPTEFGPTFLLAKAGPQQYPRLSAEEDPIIYYLILAGCWLTQVTASLGRGRDVFREQMPLTSAEFVVAA